MEDDETEAAPDAPRDDSDAQVASDIHDFRELLRTGDQEGLISALNNPDLFRTACDDDRYMEIVMVGIGVLAWDQPAKASDFLVRFDVAKARENPDSNARRAARSILAALEWRHLETQDVLPVAKMNELREFLRIYPALGSQGEHARAMHKDLHERPDFYASFFQKLALVTQILPRWIYQFDRSSRNAERPDGEPVQEESSVLAELNESQLSALSTAVSDLRSSLKSRIGRSIMWVACAGVIVALPNAIGALVALAVVGAYMGLGESKSYETIVRPRLVVLAVEHGVGAKHVVSWLYRLSRKAGRVGSFDIKIQNDQALDLLAAVSRGAAPDPEPAQGR
jgi:hypothetical protein